MRSPSRLHLCAGLLLLVSLAPAGVADDRDLFSEKSGAPYVFVIFDTSGSMNWQPGNDAYSMAQSDDPRSKMYIAKSALFEVLADPQARNIHWGFNTYSHDSLRVMRKHWLYTPKTDPPWVTDGRLAFPKIGDEKYFGDHCMADNAVGGSGCDLDNQETANGEGTDHIYGTCTNRPTVDGVTLDEGWGDILTFPVLGDDGNDRTGQWLRYRSTVDNTLRRFFVSWERQSGNLGDDELTVTVKILDQTSSCNLGGYANYFARADGEGESADIVFERALKTDPDGLPLAGASEFLWWPWGDGNSDKNGNPNSFFTATDQTQSNNVCDGWESNTDSSSDVNAGIQLTYPRVDDPTSPKRHTSAFDRGDMVPWDWKDLEFGSTGADVWSTANRVAIMKHLAPNYDPSTPAVVPDFRVAPYLVDHPAVGGSHPANTAIAPLAAFTSTPPFYGNGSTPIGASMGDFLTWFNQWKAVAGGVGGDPEFGCSTFNVLILTDGDDTCDTDSTDTNYPCKRAKNLIDAGIKTYVVGLGLAGQGNNFLNCIVEKGGTSTLDLNPVDGEPDGPGVLVPGNKQELVDSLLQVLRNIRVDARTFAAAAVPSVQAEALDKIYLTSFSPVATSPVWPGRLDAYVKPIPVVQVGTRFLPDRSKVCAPSDPDAINCLAWDAGSVLVDRQSDGSAGSNRQAPIAADLPSLRIGDGAAQRRVFWAGSNPSSGAGFEQVPMVRKDFTPPTAAPDQLDLFGAGGFELDPLDANFLVDGAQTVVNSLLVKAGTIINPLTGSLEDIDYVLGDVFHADPLAIGTPGNFPYFALDLFGETDLAGAPLPCLATDGTLQNHGYRCFLLLNRWRRRMVAASSNDGQLHVFEAGMPAKVAASGTGLDAEVDFDRGSGQELFAFLPRAGLAGVRRLAETNSLGRPINPHEFTVDGSLSIDDVFIDSLHSRPSGTPNDSNPPQAADRQWRSVIVGGMREGGSGYYALDVTQPDDIDGDLIPQPINGYVPSCLGSSPTDCGPLPWPSVLWEIEDTWDEDDNGAADLADTWSRPVIGRIRLRESSAEIDKFVAIFGGGMDADFKTNPVDAMGNPRPYSGNYLYIVDVETGKTIYKRRTDQIPGAVPTTTVTVRSSTPSEPGVIDANNDGYLDTIYIGNTAGYMYKLELTQLDSSGNTAVPELQDVTVRDYSTPNGALAYTEHVVRRIADDAAAVLDWDPLAIFSTGGRPIYFAPSVLFVPELNRYALAFGVGDREDLFLFNGQQGRFYVILDDGLTSSTTGLPFDESDYEQISAEISTSPNVVGSNFLVSPPALQKAGWYLTLTDDERLISSPVVILGVTVFSTFIPEPLPTSGSGLCGRTGNSRVYVVFATNGNALMDVSGLSARYRVVDQFVTSAFLEQSTTSNTLDREPCGGPGQPTCPPLPPAPPCPAAVTNAVRALQPAACRWATTTAKINAQQADTGQLCLAEVPTCIIQSAWREQ